MRIRLVAGIAGAVTTALAGAAVAVAPAQADTTATTHPAVQPPTVLCTAQLSVTREVAREMHIQLGSWKSPLPSRALRDKAARQFRSVQLYADAANVKAATSLKADKFFIRRLTLGAYEIEAGNTNCARPASGL